MAIPEMNLRVSIWELAKAQTDPSQASFRLSPRFRDAAPHLHLSSVRATMVGDAMGVSNAR
jgi:hypothetical protein